MGPFANPEKSLGFCIMNVILWLYPSSKACLFVKDGKCVRTEGIKIVISVLIAKD